MARKKSNGWVIVDRKILQNEIWTSPEPFDKRSALVDLILMANHEDGEFINRKGVVVKVPRGSTFTSVRHLADRWHWSTMKVQRYLKFLADTQTVTQSGTQSGTLLTLVKYDDFQVRRYTNEYTNEYTNDRRTNNEEKNKRNNNNKNRPKPLEERLEGLRRVALEGGKNEGRSD